MHLYKVFFEFRCGSTFFTISYETRGILLDYNSLSCNGFDLSKKVICRPQIKPIKRKNFSAELTKEELWFWDDPYGKKFSKQFASISIMEGQGDNDVSNIESHKAYSL